MNGTLDQPKTRQLADVALIMYLQPSNHVALLVGSVALDRALLEALCYQCARRYRHFNGKAKFWQAALLIEVGQDRAGDSVTSIDIVATLLAHWNNKMWRIAGEIVPQSIVGHRVAGGVYVMG